MALGGALGLAWSPGTPGTPRDFAWQAWHNRTSTFISRGRRGTISHPPSFRVAGVALMALGGALGLAWSPVTPGTPRRFAWQAWHNRTSTFVSRGRCGTISHPPLFRVAGVALMALGGALGLAWSPVTPGTPRRFARQAWHNLTSTFVSRGRRGTISHPPSFRVAGVALMALGGALGLAWSPVTPGTPRRFAWQAWHNLIHLRFTWQAWHNLTSTIVSRGRRGTHGTGWRAWTGLVARDGAGLCVAGVAQPHIHLRFTWQVWHNLTSTIVSCGRCGTHGTGWRAWTGLVARDAAGLCVAAWHNRTSTFVSRGRRGTISHPPSFRVAGVALMALGGALGLAWSPVTPVTPGTPRDFAWQRGTTAHPPSFHVAGVAQSHIHHRFVLQAWHSWHWVGRLDWLGRP